MSEILKTERLVNNSGAYLGRVVIAKTSLDGHWRGVSVVARALRDSGFEVILLGMVKDGEISRAAIDEDADLVGLNIGGRIQVAERIVSTLRSEGYEGPVFAGERFLHTQLKNLECWVLNAFRLDRHWMTSSRLHAGSPEIVQHEK